MVKIAQTTSESHPQQTRILLRMVIQTSASESLCEQAQKIIEQIERAEEQAEGFVRLFNGRDLAGWKKHERHNEGEWTVEDAAIVGVQDPPGSGGFLSTVEKFRDYELRLDTKIDWPFDSGVFLRVGPRGKSHQVTLDYRQGGEIGGIYGSGKGGWVKHCPEGIKYFKMDEWNQIKIICQGEPARIRIWVNDTLIMNFQHTEETTLGTPEEGTICLQIHPGGQGYDKSKARFRNIRIREL